MYKLKSNTTYTEILNTASLREEQNYTQNEDATWLTRVHIKKLEQKYTKEHIEIEGNHLAQYLRNNAYFCYDGKSPTDNDNKKEQNFLQHKEKQINTKDVYTDRCKQERKLALMPDKAFIHMTEMTAIKIS